jgi:diguanylate cyclase (GGDEF)-like protein
VDATTLFAANATILLVMALTLAVAGHGRRHEPWWRCWTIANVVLGAALVVFIVERHLPPLLIALLPNGRRSLGFGLRWRAAREFSSRQASVALVWGPLLLFVACATPFAYTSYALAFTVTNVLLTALCAAVAWEFWRDRADGLPSRYGLVAAYGVMGASFGWRILIGVFGADAIPAHLPQDTALIVHLWIALFHTVASSAFALSIAYERGNAELRHAASHDALTGLLNRGAFEAKLRAMLADPAQGPFALALLDIDHFKQINDRHGHAAGDAGLRQCAQTCLATVGGRGVVARVGGEEFAVILDTADQAEAVTLVESIRRAVGSSPVTSGPERFRMTLSGGVCHSTHAPADFDELMRLVDGGLYEAKNRGRNRIRKMAA